MGAKQSTGSHTSDSSTSSGSRSSRSGSLPSVLKSLDEACDSDRTLRDFNSATQERTRLALLSFQSEPDGPPSVSLNSLRAVTDSLLRTSHDSVELILECADVVRSNADLTALVEDYIGSSLQSLQFCFSLSSCLQKARDRHLILRLALAQFDSEDRDATTRYSKTFDELRRFRDADDPFSADFFDLFKSIMERQLQMMDKLQARKTALDKKLKNVKLWKRISTVIFVSTFSAVLVCSVVAAAVSAPPVVAAVVAAGAAAVGPAGKWFNSLWTNYSERLKGEMEVVRMMEAGNKLVIGELLGIMALVEKMVGEMEGLLENAEFAGRGEEAVRIGVEEIERKMGEFVGCIEDLEKRSKECSEFIVKARALVLTKVTNLR